MLKSLKIENFRCFQLFELQQLGRVNLLVGTNNSGKTSILEAIQLFCSRTNLETFSNSNQRIPIASMGDGMWRMLGLTLAIFNARNGVLLVDEIDTGLHFSAMSDMWKLVWETAN